MAILKKIWLRLLRRNEFDSARLRSYFSREYGVEVGMYSYGCFDPTRIPRGTKVGRYCSFSSTSIVFNGNHGVDFLSTHPYLYNVNLGMVSNESIVRTACEIEDDVWLGHGSVILPSVKVVGRGAIIAAGAVVTKDVPRYAVVAGNPAKVVKYRFNEELIKEIEKLQWWCWNKEKFLEVLRKDPELFYAPGLRLLAHS